MDYDEFRWLVADMRKKQKRYFSKRDNLEEAMASERAVDAALDRLAVGPGLFDGEGEGKDERGSE